MRSNNNYNGKENVNIKSKNLFFNFHRLRLQLFFSFLKMLQYIILTNNIQQKCRWLLVVLIIKKNYTHLKLHQQQMDMAASAIQDMVVLQEAGSELRGYYYFFLRVRSIEFSFFFVLVVFNLFFLISACHQEVFSKIQGI